MGESHGPTRTSLVGAVLLAAMIGGSAATDDLEAGFRNPPPASRPHAYWLWLNGYLDPETARAELRAMKDAGFSGVLMFDMGARGDKALQPPAGPAFLSPPWMKQFQESVRYANQLGLQFDFSVVSSWDLGGHWIEPRHASMALYPTETTVTGGGTVDIALPFPPVPAGGKPAFWQDIAVLAARDADLVDVTSHVGRDGRLKWEAPAGKWTIRRYVCMNTGERLKVPSPASDGWATDHLNPEATRAHMQYVIGRLKETFGDLKRSGITNLYLASYEVRGQIWSPGFTAEFRRRRGYDMTPYLPAIFGSTVGGDEKTARFLFDYRKTLGEVLVDAYYVAARNDAHAAGLLIKSEAGGPGPPLHNVPVDALLAHAAVDSIQGEFWPYRQDADNMWVVKEPASAGHLYGKQPVHLEAFTSMENWREGPGDLKASADRVFCEGGNHMVWHTWTHNPPEAGLPGWGYYAGTHVNRNVTWWPKIRPFVDYLSRASFLLQRGKFVAEVLYYYGDGGYKFIGPRRNEASLGPGYDYDVTNSDVILNRLDVRDGRLVLPDGMSYALLALPDSEEANPAVLARIEKLVAGGATLVGRKPARAHGLEGYPASDARVREIAARMWGDLDGRSKTSRAHGKGRVVWGMALREVLASMKIGADFTGPEPFDYIHRRDGATDIYFVRNKTASPVKGTLQFRVANRQPELWDAVSGRMREAAFRRLPQSIQVPLELASNGSTFVIFRRPARAAAASPAEPVVVRSLPLEGGWSVEFEPGRGAPAGITLPELTSWSKHSDPGVRYFSGTATYRKTFTLPADWRRAGSKVELDLGRLWAIGEVWLNGKSLGILWTPPFAADGTTALRDGENELAVEVTNTWFNRLVGDAKRAGPQRITRTNVASSGGKPWAALEPLESGLFGPVRLVLRRSGVGWKK